MKISGAKKLILICLSLILALTTALFAAHLLSRNTYAQVSPDGLSAYADGEGAGEGENNGENEGDSEKPKVPDAGAIAPPVDFDDDDDDWTTIQQQITIEVGKLTIRIEGWNAQELSTKPAYNTNPDGIYNDYPDLVSKIETLLKSDLIVRTLKDAYGTVVTDDQINSLPAGTTLFIHFDVNEKYSDSVQLIYREGVTKSYPYTIGFPAGEKLIEVDKPTELYFVVDFLGEELNFKDKINEILKDKDAYLMLVESESDSLIQNGAGEFRYVICFRDGAKYCWKNTGIENDRSPITITIKVKPLELEVKTDFDLLGEWYYTGFDIDISELLKETYKGYVTVAAGYTTVGKDAKEYTFNIMIDPKYEDSVTWKDYDEEYVTIKWTIKPSVITGEWLEPQCNFGRITITSDTYPGIQSGDIEYVYRDHTTQEVVTELVVGGEYDAQVIIKNDKNLVWSTEPSVHTFTLTKELEVFARPEISAKEKEFTGADITFSITIDGKPITSEEFVGKIEIDESLSDSLTQKNVGKYKVVIKIIDEAVSWPGYDTGDVVIEFEITKIELDVEWKDPIAPTFISSYTSDDYSSIVKIEYRNSLGVVVTKAQMVKGETYTAVLTLIDETNFKWASTAKLTYSFTLDIDFVALDKPVLSDDDLSYTGNNITVSITNRDVIEEYIKLGYIEIVTGSFDQKNAGTYSIVLKIKENTYIWADYDSDYFVLEYTINKAVLKGEWQTNGKVNFTSSFTGDYNTVVEYVYTNNATGEVVTELKEGVEYTASVKLRAGMEDNFDDSMLPPDFTFTYEADEEEGGSSLWWLWLLIGLLVLIIIIIIIIIIIVKRRNKDDDYDDFYDDEYYGDEDLDGNGEEGDGDYDDYGDYGDYGSDTGVDNYQ